MNVTTYNHRASAATPRSDDASPMLEVRSLRKVFSVAGPPPAAPGWRFWKNRSVPRDFVAVDDVSFDLRRHETLGIVGESGSGKTTVARCVLRAMDPTAGSIRFHPRDGQTVDLAHLRPGELRPLRREMQMIFQDPYSSLNPRMSVGNIVAEPLVIHRQGTKAQRRERVAAMLERVGLSADHMSRYPHAFSGGQRQRIGIARALILNPQLVIADESVSALDVSVQAQVLALLKELQQELGLTYIFISHDLAVVSQVCDRVAVMYKGRIMEMGPARQIFRQPRHAYTKVLLSAVPQPDPRRRMQPRRVADLTPEELEPLPELVGG